jgi:hypothetical protein
LNSGNFWKRPSLNRILEIIGRKKNIRINFFLVVRVRILIIQYDEANCIPTQIWYLQEKDGFEHLLELNFQNRLKNVECKLDERLLFDLKLKGYETIYPLRIGAKKYTLFLRKKPVGGYECEVIDEEKNRLPYRTDRPRNFGKPRKHWNKIIPIVGYGIALAWVILIIVLSIKVFLIQ